MTLRSPNVGDLAPDFTLPSTSGSDVTLSALRGDSNVLLAFFPLAFTGTCTAEMCSFTEDFSHFDEVDARVLGISVDSGPTLKEFAAKNDITIDLLSDFKRDVCRAYGTLLDDLFFSSRSYFIVDKAGKIQWKFTEPQLGEKRNNSELLAELKSVA